MLSVIFARCLLFQGSDIPGAIMDFCPWIDQRTRTLDEIVETTGGQTHRRSLKTHLPLDGVPYREDVRYIYVGRVKHLFKEVAEAVV